MNVYLITAESLLKFGYLIPEQYQQEIVNQRLIGIGIVDPFREDEVVGVMLAQDCHNWMEIVWIHLDELYQGMDYASTLISYCVHAVQERGRAWGAFSNLPSGRIGEILTKDFLKAGFELVPTTHHSYTATIELVKNAPLFQRLAQENGSNRVVPLAKVDDSLKRKLSAVLYEATVPVPLPSPLLLERYHQSISCIHLNDSNAPDGLLFLSDKGDHLTVECAWTAAPTALIPLLGNAIQEAQKLYPDEMEIFVPTVTDVSAKLVEKMIPDAKPIEGLQARLLFS